MIEIGDKLTNPIFFLKGVWSKTREQRKLQVMNERAKWRYKKWCRCLAVDGN
jgi:hypothetical protein